MVASELLEVLQFIMSCVRLILLGFDLSPLVLNTVNSWEVLQDNCNHNYATYSACSITFFQADLMLAMFFSAAFSAIKMCQNLTHSLLHSSGFGQEVRAAPHVFDPSLFLHWDLFQKESPGSSERSFLKSLEQFSYGKGLYESLPPPPLVFGVSNCNNLVFLLT